VNKKQLPFSIVFMKLDYLKSFQPRS